MPSPTESAQIIVNKAINELLRELPGSLTRYLVEVLEWNSVLSLVSRRDPVAACERLLLESIELGDRVQVGNAGRLADVGSGAGFPGLVWALMYPQLDVVLIERREKRAIFLERTSRTLGLHNVTVLASDLGDVSRGTGTPNTIDLVSAIAVGDPASIAGDVERLLPADGRFACTIPRRFTEKTRLGESLHLVERFDGKFGCYVVYRRGV